MTATLVAKGLAGGYAARTLFDSLDLTVAPGDVIGVVGVNGAGKSTLLKLLGGVEQPLAGTVSLAPADAFGLLVPGSGWSCWLPPMAITAGVRPEVAAVAHAHPHAGRPGTHFGDHHVAGRSARSGKAATNGHDSTISSAATTRPTATENDDSEAGASGRR